MKKFHIVEEETIKAIYEIEVPDEVTARGVEAVYEYWYEIETAKALGKIIDVNDQVDKAMRDVNLKVEGRVDGKWVPIEEAPFEEQDDDAEEQTI